jgi:hypothetical protein
VPPQPAPPPKKGLSSLAWIGIGCGALAVIAAIGFTIMLAAGGWTFDTNNAEGRSASFSLSTPDTGDKVLSFYESQLKEAGLKVDSTITSNTAEGKGGILTASGENPHREISVLVGASDGQTTAAITFQEKK